MRTESFSSQEKPQHRVAQIYISPAVAGKEKNCHEQKQEWRDNLILTRGTAVCISSSTDAVCFFSTAVCP